VLNVKPSLDRVDVLVEVNDAGTVIPRNSVIEANQSGLIAEPLVDITPQLPLPTYTASEWGLKERREVALGAPLAALQMCFPNGMCVCGVEGQGIGGVRVTPLLLPPHTLPLLFFRSCS
jgi:hypothetical protein